MKIENEDSKQILVSFFEFDIEAELQGIRSAKSKLEVLKKRYLQIE